MAGSTFWWVAAGIAVTVELATGTFYLLMIALGMAAAALAAHGGLSATAQIITAALVAGGATTAWHVRRRRGPKSAAARENRDVNLDIGEAVRVDAWDADRNARVHHRGAPWTARLAPGAPAAPGLHTVVAVEGNWLVLAPVVAPVSAAGS